MASSQTTNYSLPQWSKSDRIQMSDFNTAMSTIDAALAEKAKIAVGTYTGNAYDNDSTLHTITIGFKPRAVFIQAALTSTGNSGYSTDLSGLATREKQLGSLLTLTDTGFSVRNYRDSQGYVSSPRLNITGYTYNYIAIG